MATKRPSLPPRPPPSPRSPLTSITEVRASWFEIEITPAPAAAKRPRVEPPPLPRESLPGIVVQDDWIEATPSSRRPKRKAQPPPLPAPTATDSPPRSKRPRKA